MLEKMLNSITINGELLSKEYSHEIKGTKFYNLEFSVPRLSSKADYIKAVYSENDLPNMEIGGLYQVEGQIRTRNVQDERKNTHLDVYLFAYNTTQIDELTSLNEVKIEGIVVRQPVYRVTNTGRRITELLIANNRSNNKSNYLPTICWGDIADQAQDFEVSQGLYVEARLQSREYVKVVNGEPVSRRTMELSVTSLKTDEFNTEEE